MIEFDEVMVDLIQENQVLRTALRLQGQIVGAAREVDTWKEKLVKKGGLCPPEYCPPLERLRSTLRRLDAEPKGA